MTNSLRCSVSAGAGERYGLTHSCPNPAIGTNAAGRVACAAHGGPATTPADVRARRNAQRCFRQAAAAMLEARTFKGHGLMGLTRGRVRTARKYTRQGRAALATIPVPSNP